MTIQTGTGFVLPPIYAIGTGLPVILFSLFLAISVRAAGHAFRAVQRIEKFVRIAVALLFLAIGGYYVWRMVLPLPLIG
jgi:cytochrome c biogenesis protein CcdA